MQVVIRPSMKHRGCQIANRKGQRKEASGRKRSRQNQYCAVLRGSSRQERAKWSNDFHKGKSNGWKSERNLLRSMCAPLADPTSAACKPLFQLILPSGLMGCHGPTDPSGGPHLPLSGLSQQWVTLLMLGHLLLFIFLLGSDEKKAESEELFYRHAYKMYPWI